MSKKLLYTPEGVRDIYHVSCKKKRILEKKLHQVLSSYGYHDIETPTLEYLDVFSSDVGTVSEKELYQFFDREGDTLVLRPDMTPSIARFVSTAYREEDMAIRLCYVGQTFVNYRSYQGQLKERTQLGAEFIGDDTVQSDGEMIALAVELLQSAGLKEFQVSIGHVDFFKSIVKEARIEKKIEEELRHFITNKNVCGVEEVLKKCTYSKEIQMLLLQLPTLSGSIEHLKKLLEEIETPSLRSSLERLVRVHEILSFYQLDQKVSFDLSMLNNYDYYTGIVFRGYTKGVGDPVITGGRYDQLLSYFGKSAAAIGVTVTEDRLLEALLNQGVEIPVKEGNTMVLYEKEEEKMAILLARQFRKSGVLVELFYKETNKSLEQYIEFARRNGIGGVLYFKEGGRAEIIPMEHGERVTVDIDSLMK